MASSFAASIFVPLLMILIILRPSTAVTEDLLERICKKISDSEFCLKILKSDPGTPSADLAGLVQISINLESDYITQTIAAIKSLYNQTPDGPLKEWYSNCEQYYGNAKHGLQQATSYLQAHDRDEVMSSVSLTKSQSQDCDNDSLAPKPSPLEKYSLELSRYADVATNVASSM